MENQPPAVSIVQYEVRNLETSKVAEIAETEVDRLRDELRLSSDRETGVCAQAPKALKEA